MSTIAGQIEIQLMAGIARLQADMDRARRVVEESTSAMGRAATLAKGALGAIAGVLSIGAFAGWVKGAIDATDAVSDISQATGVAIKDIAGLQLWFQKGGMEAGAFETSMIKLSREIAGGSETLQQLGVRTRDASGNLRTNVDVLMDSADAFAKMQDGTAKTALAVEAFGKSGAALIPMLNEGSEGLREMTEMADRLGLTFDQKTVDAAGAFNDTLDFMGMASQGVGRQIAAQLLPTLNSLVGSMFTFVTSGDGVRKAADVIGTGFKMLYTAGVGVVTLFNVLGKTIAGSMAFISNNLGTLFTGLKQAIEGNYSDAWRTITSGGMRAGAILSTTFDDVTRDMSAAATTITDVWTGAGGEAVAALAGMNKESRRVTDEERKRAAKAMESANNFIKAQQKEREEIGLNKDQQRMLTAVRAAAAAPTQKQRDTILQLAAAIEAETKAWNASESARQAAENAVTEDSRTLLQLQERARGLELEIELHGKTAEAAVYAEAAKVRATASSLAISEEYRDQLILQAQELERIAKLTGGKEGLDASKKAAEQQLADQVKMWDSVEQTAHDTFVSIFDSGKSAFDRLRDTLKNGLLDLLYQMTVKKWIFNIGASVGLTGGAAGAAQAGAVAGGGSALSSVSSLSGLANFGGSAIAGIGNFIGSSSMSAFGAGFAGNTMGMATTASEAFASMGMAAEASAASFGQMAGAVLPWVAGAVAVFTLAKKAFSMGPKEYSGTSTLSGHITPGGLDAGMYADWTKQGGWLRSDKSGSDRQAVGGELSAGIVSTYDAIKTSTADYAKALGLNADMIAGRAQGLSITFGKDEAANQKAIADFFTGVADNVAREVLPSMDLFTRSGETAAQTLQRMAVNAAGVEQVLASIGIDSKAAFGAVSNVSLLARERLVDFAGGLEAFAANTAGFQQNFLTEAERNAPVLKAVTEQMTALGYAAIDTRLEFKELLLGLNPADEADGKLLASLLKLQGAFAQVYPVIEATTAAADTAAEALAQVNKGYQDQIDDLLKAGMSPAARRALEVQGMDASTVALYDRLAALRLEASALEQLTARTQAVADERRGLQDQFDSLSMSSAQLLLKQRDALDESNRALFDQVRAIERVNAVAQERQGLQDRLDSMQLTTDQLRDREIGKLDLSNQALLRQIFAIEDHKAALEAQAVAQRDATQAAEEARRNATQAAEEARRAAIQAAKDRGANLLSGVDSAFSALQSVVGREKALLQEVTSKHQALASALRGTLDSMSPGGQEREDRLGAQAQIRAALAIAKASGVLPDVDSIKGALSVVGKDSSALFATQQDYLRDFYSTQADIASLAGLTDKTLSVEEKSIKRLDDIVSSAQQQVNALKGIDLSILSLAEVMRGFNGALGAAQADPVASSGGSLAKLYRDLLGRAPDAAGLDFYKDRMTEGVTLEAIRKAIMGSAEYKGLRGFAVGTNYVATDMPAMIHQGERIMPAADNRELMRRLASPSEGNAALTGEVRRLTGIVEKQQQALDRIAASTGQLADQFDQVTEGANAMRTDVVNVVQTKELA